ncbi:hypothetical protein NDU88_005807 [Pleurodeles waltl]|uniref:Uncharacterized protein n=1 Tax=Pleurodeles waltl TaxID=8319 RepID=A0AAV7MYL9_PLEWA|nr:hypothetical protein NDU88_005807 [Pleurodeles waltl]
MARWPSRGPRAEWKVTWLRPSGLLATMLQKEPRAPGERRRRPPLWVDSGLREGGGRWGKACLIGDGNGEGHPTMTPVRRDGRPLPYGIRLGCADGSVRPQACWREAVRRRGSTCKPERRGAAPTDALCVAGESDASAVIGLLGDAAEWSAEEEMGRGMGGGRMNEKEQ